MIKLTAECKNWKNLIGKKKIFSMNGVVSRGIVKSLFFIQGACLAASYDHYDKIFAIKRS